MTKIAPITPAFCCACFQAGPEKRYVDFDAAYDGPVLTIEDGRKQPIDDLVICENCLNEAFDLLDPEGLKDRVRELEAIIAGMQADIDSKDGQIERLGVTTTELLHHPIKRSGGGYGLPDGPIPDEVKEYIRDKRAQRNKIKMAKPREPR